MTLEVCCIHFSGRKGLAWIALVTITTFNISFYSDNVHIMASQRRRSSVSRESIHELDLTDFSMLTEANSSFEFSDVDDDSSLLHTPEIKSPTRTPMIRPSKSVFKTEKRYRRNSCKSCGQIELQDDEKSGVVPRTPVYTPCRVRCRTLHTSSALKFCNLLSDVTPISRLSSNSS